VKEVDAPMKTTYPDDAAADAALADPALSQLFDAIRAAGDGPVPAIGGALAAVMAGAASLMAARNRRRTATRAGVVGLVAVGALGAGIGAAAADELPRPVQRVVANVVGTLTPFQLPNPDEQGTVQDPQGGPADSPGDQPGQDVQSPGLHQGSGDNGGAGQSGPSGAGASSTDDQGGQVGPSAGPSNADGTSGASGGDGAAGATGAAGSTGGPPGSAGVNQQGGATGSSAGHDPAGQPGGQGVTGEAGVTGGDNHE
jgi:hypothetical protein